MLEDPESTPDQAIDTAVTPRSSVTTALIVGVLLLGPYIGVELALTTTGAVVSAGGGAGSGSGAAVGASDALGLTVGVGLAAAGVARDVGLAVAVAVGVAATIAGGGVPNAMAPPVTSSTITPRNGQMIHQRRARNPLTSAGVPVSPESTRSRMAFFTSSIVPCKSSWAFWAAFCMTVETKPATSMSFIPPRSRQPTVHLLAESCRKCFAPSVELRLDRAFTHTKTLGNCSHRLVH